MSTRTGATKIVFIIVAAVAAFGVVAFVVVFFIGTALFSNEMACSEGEAPANTTQGGSACFIEGSDLPPGFTWDARGNYKIN